MHHQGVICTRVHKGDYVFWKIQGTLMIFCFGGSLKTHTKTHTHTKSVRLGQIDTLDTHDPVGAAPYIFYRFTSIWTGHTVTIIFGFTMDFCTYMYLNGSHGWFIGSQVFEWVTLLQLFLGSQVSAFQLNGNVCDYLVDLGHFLGQESHDFPGLITWNIAIYSKRVSILSILTI